MILAALLKKTHVRILRARNGKEAIQIASGTASIDLILMDISMPDSDGIEALRFIRQQLPGKIVIAQTAHDLSSLEIINEKFDGFLLKPIRRKELLETLSKYLS